MSGEISVGYARCSTKGQDLRAQSTELKRLGIAEDRIYVDAGYTGRNRDRPGLDEALAAVREGDTFVVTKLDRLGRSITDLRDIADTLASRGVRLSIGAAVYDPTDPVGKLMFNMLAMVAEFESDIIRARTKAAMAEAAKAGRLKGRSPKLSPLQTKKLLEDYESGKYTIRQLMELYPLGKTAIYATIKRAREASTPS